jgi:hypothetical protein
MPSTLTSPQINAKISVNAAFGNLSTTILLGLQNVLSIGTSAGQIQYASVVPNNTTVAAGSPTTYDLTSMPDVFTEGGTITFGYVTHIFIVNYNTVTGDDLTLEGGTSNPLFSDVRTIKAGSASVPSYDLFQSGGVGYTVASGTKTIVVVAAADTITYGMIVLGR